SLVSIFILILILIILGKISVDYSISNLIMKIWSQQINWFFIFLGNYAQKMMIIITIAVSVSLYLKKKKIQFLGLISCLGIGYCLKEIVKAVVQRDRPLVQLMQETGYSFPSGHSVFSMILFSFIIYLYKDEIKNNARKFVFISAGIFLILLVGFSRIYLNVHWLTDVIGGYALGFFLFNLSVLFLKRKNNYTPV
ncbi:MAG: phosphatase PAP2 family protein, partial [Nanoarchaeota archaeon]|nr:phosphatase PAP2 family protein [Nanoarchaeota archaeon]